MFLNDDSISNVIFFPRRAPKPSPSDLPENCQILEFEVQEGINVGGLFFSANPELPTLLLFHGNGEIIHDYLHFATKYMECEVNFAVADFRGYGFSDGKPAYMQLFKDCYPIYHGVRKHLEDEGFNSDIFVFGRSLGSTCAAELGSKAPYGMKGVIFESGFSSAYKIMTRLFRLSLPSITEETLKDYSNYIRVRTFTKPTLIMHGSNDFIIPVDEGKDLFNSVPDGVPKKKIIIDGAGHNDIMMWEDEYFPPIREFIKKYK